MKSSPEIVELDVLALQLIYGAAFDRTRRPPAKAHRPARRFRRGSLQPDMRAGMLQDWKRLKGQQKK